ncbi:hypothetical protein D3C77_791860 [compost metagenome]|jgi:hypothetical protein
MKAIHGKAGDQATKINMTSTSTFAGPRANKQARNVAMLTMMDMPIKLAVPLCVKFA